MIAQVLALALAVASPGPARTRPAAVLRVDNLARARRGLLPRKVVRTRTRARGRLLVLRPQSPTWLGAPAEPPADAPAAAPPVDGARAPAAARVEPALAAVSPGATDPAPGRGPAPSRRPLVDDAGPRPLGASLEGVAVRWMLVRNRAAWDPAVRATVAAPELEAVLLRRRGG